MKRLLAILVLAAALAACGGIGSSAAPSQSLEGTSWTLVKIGEQDVTLEAPPTLTVAADGSVSGSTGCNTYNGTATIEGDSISFGPLATTRVFCSGAPGITETAFLAAIKEVEAFAIDSQGRLMLEDGVVLVFEPAPQASRRSIPPRTCSDRIGQDPPLRWLPVTSELRERHRIGPNAGHGRPSWPIRTWQVRSSSHP